MVTRVLALGMLITIIPGAAALADPLTQMSQTSAADAYLDLGPGTYAGAGFLASGNPQAWYNSPQVVQLFGGVPDAQQQQSFDQAIMQRVQQTFQLSGINLALTENAGASALHTMSLVSNSSSAAFPGAIGTTDLGANGMSFIDPMAQSAQSVDQLEWIVAHNISHELMLAFGVGENYDQTGNYIDARNANFAMLVDPNATFRRARPRPSSRNCPTAASSRCSSRAPSRSLPRPPPSHRPWPSGACSPRRLSPPPGSTARDVDDRGRGLLGDDDVLDVTSRPAPAG